MMSAEAVRAPASSSKSVKPPKTYSCVLCAQRKVKCDKNNPCSNCVKARVECVQSTPAPPQRRKRRAPEDVNDSHARLKRLESLLIRRGISIEDLENDDPGLPKGQSNGTLKSEPPSKFVESNLWTTLSEEILEGSSEDDKAGLLKSSSPSSPKLSPDGTRLVFDGRPRTAGLAAYHPPTVKIFRLWQTFLENVNPLIKIIHAPTVQMMILGASEDIEGVSPETEALMFAIYSCAVLSLSNSDCQAKMNKDRSFLLDRYLAATEQALVNVGLLRSSELIVLQAFVLFLISVRQSYDAHFLWIFTGIAVRIGQKLGLHREASLSKLSPFQAEFGRRLWWQIVLIEGRTGELAGSGSSLLAHLWDTRMPLNLNDNEMLPDMKQFRSEHTGSTEMIFALMRCQLGEFMNSPGMAAYGGFWHRLSSQEVTLEDKDKMIDELEAKLEEKFVKHCDTVIAIHALTEGVIRCAIGRMRIIAHHPRQYPHRKEPVPQHEKDRLFDTCLMMMEKDNFGHSAKMIERFLWHVNFNFQIDALVYMLYELRIEPMGRRADVAWETILEVFEHHPELINTKSHLHFAVGSLALKSWEAREAAFRERTQAIPEIDRAGIMSVLRSQRQNITSLPVHLKEDSRDGSQTDSYENYTNPPPYTTGAFDPNLSTQVLGPDLTPMDWVNWTYWNNLFEGAQMR